MDNKHKAQQRADQIQSFHDEVKLLESDQVLQLDSDQREAVARYPVVPPASSAGVVELGLWQLSALGHHGH